MIIYQKECKDPKYVYEQAQWKVLRCTRKPFSFLPLNAALCAEHSFMGKNRAATFSQGSVFLLFNTAHVFSIRVRLDGWPNPPKPCLPACLRQWGHRKSRSNSHGVRETGGSGPWKTLRRWSPTSPGWRQASLFHFLRRKYWVKVCPAMEKQWKYIVDGWGSRESMARSRGVCHFH